MSEMDAPKWLLPWEVTEPGWYWMRCDLFPADMETVNIFERSAGDLFVAVTGETRTCALLDQENCFFQRIPEPTLPTEPA